jgi:hypothetical protein
MAAPTCQVCGGRVRYSEPYDAGFCPRCDRWTEGKCHDPTCEYCSHRPARPSDVADHGEDAWAEQPPDPNWHHHSNCPLPR